MNHYFAGSMKSLDAYLIEKGCNRLMSYYYQRSEIDAWIQQGGKPLFIDSGAYTAHTKGVTIDVNDYIAFLNEYDPYIEICVQLDTIPGEFGKAKTMEQMEEAAEQTWQNYLYMYDRLKSPHKLLPVFHQGEDFKHLKRILEHKPPVQYMGISPANDLPQRQKNIWIDRCFKIIKNSSNPNIKTHALGMTSLAVLERTQFYSADSTAWLAGGRNGTITTRFGAIYVSAKGKDKANHLVNQKPHIQEAVKKEVEAYGYNLDELMNCYKARLRWNVDYLLRWLDTLVVKPKPVSQNNLLL